MRKLKWHEQKLLKKVNLLAWKSEHGRREVEVMRRYHIQDRDDYKKYNKLAGMVSKLCNALRDLPGNDEERQEMTRLLSERLFAMGLVNSATAGIRCGAWRASRPLRGAGGGAATRANTRAHPVPRGRARHIIRAQGMRVHRDERLLPSAPRGGAREEQDGGDDAGGGHLRGAGPRARRPEHRDGARAPRDARDGGLRHLGGHLEDQEEGDEVQRQVRSPQTLRW